MNRIKLYSAWYCPFAQRAWLALLHKEVAFEYIEVDPYEKTQQWMEISRQQGQVPVLVLPEGSSVVDSSRIVEFLDITNTQSSPLFSPDAAESAEQKYWIDFINSKIIPYFYRFLKNDESTKIGQEAKQKMLDGVKSFSKAINHQGDFFSGDSINAVDLNFIPFAYRMNLLLAHYRGFKLPTNGKDWQHYHRWYRMNTENSVFQQTSSAQDNYEKSLIDFYLPYSQGGGQKDVDTIDA